MTYVYFLEFQYDMAVERYEWNKLQGNKNACLFLYLYMSKDWDKRPLFPSVHVIKFEVRKTTFKINI